MNLPLIGQGSTFGGKKYYDNKKLKLFILEHGFSQGINLIDTGEYYEGGIAEEIVGEFLKGKRDKIIISDKFKASNNSYDGVIQSCEASLRRLKTDYIDLYQIQWSNPEIPLEETLSALFKLKEEGKIRYIGVCNYTFREFKNISHLVNSIQTEFNLQNRLILDNLLPYCQENFKVIIGYNIFNQGFLKLDNYPYLTPIALKYNKTVYQVILAWAISKGILMLTNTMNPVHLKENIEATELKLEKEDISLIDKSYKPPILIDPKLIKVEQQKIDDAHKVYCTLDEVINNADKIHPNPFILAEEIRKKGLLKPIEVSRNGNGYNLIHGSARYFSWRIAFKDTPIPAFVI